jgi:hypothetical protein
LKQLEVTFDFIPPALSEAVQGMESLETLTMGYLSNNADLSLLQKRQNDRELMDKVLVALQNCPRFYCLETTISPLNGRGFPQLKALTHLTSLITGDRQLENIGKIPNLTHLMLLPTDDKEDDTIYYYNNTGLSALAPLTKLHYIAFNNPALSFTYLPVLPNLEFVMIEKMTMSGDDIDRLSRCPNIRVLQLRSCIILPGDEKHFSGFRELIRFSFSAGIFGKRYKSSSNLEEFPMLPKLECINIGSSDLTDTAVLRLLELPKLRNASIFAEAITEEVIGEASRKGQELNEFNLHIDRPPTSEDILRMGKQL